MIPTPPACTAIQVEPTPGSEAPSLFVPESETDHVRGAESPLITITEYSDYQDLRSGLLAKVIDQLLDDHPNELRVVSRIFPLISINDKAALAAQAAEAAGEQDKFWEMHHLLYAQQETWVKLSAADFEPWLSAQVSALGMNVDQFQTDLKREDIVKKVQQAWEGGQKIGLPGTPLILINGQIYSGPRDHTSLNDIIQLVILGKRQYTSCPAVTVQQNKQYITTLHTEKGDIVIQLFADKAPMTVNSFLFLVREGWYENITFHRVIPDLFAQTGDPSGTGKGNPGYYIITEINPSLTFDKPGMVAMVNSGPDTSGSQFFITYAPTTQYNGQYTIFGQVLNGMDVLKQLTPRDAQPGSDTPPGDKLIDITIQEK
jgi:cyclophilin family peptidyl-prolyl cis-trans isomerase/protein-disulfide isomerase